MMKTEIYKGFFCAINLQRPLLCHPDFSNSIHVML
jgi:hypothetical protein